VGLLEPLDRYLTCSRNLRSKHVDMPNFLRKGGPFGVRLFWETAKCGGAYRIYDALV
jgi:hypothetical protein